MVWIAQVVVEERRVEEAKKRGGTAPIFTPEPAIYVITFHPGVLEIHAE
jgi:hypothetical protein